MLKLLALILLALFAFSILYNVPSGRVALACSCIEIKPPQVEYEQSNAVFSGKIVNLETTDDYFPSKVATFDVYTIWKGISQDTVVITTGMGGADCGYPFEENGEYLVYAYGEEDAGLGASSCSQTKPLDRAEADLAALGEGREVSNAVLYRPEIWSYPNPFLLVGIAAGIIGAIAAGVIITRRRSK